MKLRRRYQVLPTYAYCGDACGWYAAALPEPEIEEGARTHARETGHQAVIVSTSHVVFDPALPLVPAEVSAP